MLIVDLTEKYGAGYEPSIDVCDRIFNNKKSIIVGFESDIGGTYAVPYVEYKFNQKHDSYGITIKFPPTAISTEFTISYYDGESLIETSRMVRRNTKEIYTNEDTRLQWNRVRITMAQNTGRGARIQYVIFGVSDQYKEDELISVKANRTLSPTAEYADSGEVSFSFFNDGRYDIQTIKELSQNVIDKLKMQVFVRRQFETQYIPFGVYYAESGKVEERGHVITLTGHDGIFKLDDVMFTSGKVYTAGRSLADWAREVANTAGVQIEIAAAFEGMMSTGYISEVPCREAFRLIAEAGHGIFGVDENDVFHLWTYDDIIKTSDDITDENIVDKSFSLENSNKYMGVKITQYAFTKRTEEEELGKVENLEITNSVKTLEIDFSSEPVDIDSIRIESLSGTTAITEKTSSKVKFTIFGTKDETTTVIVYGIAYDITTNTIERGETKKDVKEITDNYLITSELGEGVANYQNLYSVNKYNYYAETFLRETLALGEVRTMQGQKVVITDIGFSISYEDQSEEIGGIDE